MAGVILQVHYIPVHLQPFYKKNYGFKLKDYPCAEEFYANEVSLPIYPGLTKDDQEKIIHKLDYYLNI